MLKLETENQNLKKILEETDVKDQNLISEHNNQMKHIQVLLILYLITLIINLLINFISHFKNQNYESVLKKEEQIQSLNLHLEQLNDLHMTIKTEKDTSNEENSRLASKIIQLEVKKSILQSLYKTFYIKKINDNQESMLTSQYHDEKKANELLRLQLDQALSKLNLIEVNFKCKCFFI